MTLVAGTYRARGVDGGLGETSKGDPQIAVELEVLDEGFAGETITWFGYFTDKTKERTFDALRTLGWKGDDLSDLSGISENEVKIVVKEDTYEGETRLKVAWINKPGGLALKTPMTPDKAKAFAAQMKGEAIESRKRSGTPAAKPAGKPPAPSNGRTTNQTPPADFNDQDPPF